MQRKQLAQEYPPDSEREFTEQIVRQLKAKLLRDNPPGIMRRDAHPKMHGVVKAEFTVEPDLPTSLRVGLFETQRTFQAWIRFSNASAVMQPDAKRDIRGMAIKLMDVAGEKLLENEKQEQTHDFLLVSTDVFLAGDVREFAGFLQAMTGSLLAKILFFPMHWRLIFNLIGSMGKCANPLQARYWSTTPYLFGDRAVKYSVIPRVETRDGIPADPDGNFLRAAMRRHLQESESLFDFCVQFQTDPECMPIEDAGRSWSERDSPFRKVATIRIPRQQFDTDRQNEFGENLSFTPWHALPQHRPLGGVNRARKTVYEFISSFRHQENQAPRKEPVSWDM